MKRPKPLLYNLFSFFSAPGLRKNLKIVEFGTERFRLAAKFKPKWIIIVLNKISKRYMKSIEVVAAIIVFNNKILCVQRGENKYEYISKKYEFPGGKMELGELKNQAIKREILEELNMQIEVEEEYLTVTHHYPDFIIVMHSFICACASPILTLTEHIDYKWLSANELSTLDWAAADIPIVEKLMKHANEFN